MTSMNGARAVAVLGGDARQIRAAAVLAEKGFEVLAWGGGLREAYPEGIRRCSDWREAVELSEALLLPLPATADGVHLFCPLLAEGEAPRMDILLSHASGRRLLGGRLSESLLRRAEACGVRCTDYFDSEILQLKNALPTAEGAISVAMRELPVTLDGAHAAVIGYGRIGELLARKLILLGARVTVYARRAEALTRAALSHCEAVSLGTENAPSALTRLPRSVRVIFNTVPVRLFSASVRESLPAGCVFIDLASAPGGIDHTAAEAAGLRCIWATSLPGKYAPETAGQIIADTASLLLGEGSV